MPVAIVAGLFALREVPESKAHGNTSFDIPGAILVSGGLVALVYASTEAAKEVRGADGSLTTVGWTDPVVVTLLVVAVVALVAFVILETRVKNPLLPLRVALDRNRGGSYLIFLLAGGGMFAMFLFLGFYFQVVHGWSPMKAGVAMLPFSIGMIAMAGVVARLLPRVGPRPLMITGLTLAACGLLVYTTTTPTSSYWLTVFPGMVIMSIGMSMVFIPASSTALVGVKSHDAGVASALLNTSQQVGGSLGLALLNTFAISAIAGFITDKVAAGTSPTDQAMLLDAQVHGYHVAYAWGAGFFVVALLVAIFVIRADKSSLAGGQAGGQGAETAAVHAG